VRGLVTPLEFGELGSTSPGKTDHSILEGRRRHRPGAYARFGRSWFEIPQRSSLTPLPRYAILSVSTGEQALPRPTRWSNEASRVRHFDWWREPAADGPSAGPKPLRPKFNGW
jgi:hypothetical protein